MGATATLTVLFSDVVGSTALQTAAGDLGYDEVRARMVERSAASVAKHEGSLVKTLGDGIMATFVAAADAMAAAVEIQQVCSTLAVAGRPVSLRVGLSAGDVLVDGDDCHGRAVVEAARLCAAADPGQILCSDVVVALARGRRGEFEIQAAGQRALKGLDEPVAVFELGWLPASIANRGGPLPSALMSAASQPFTGREAERSLLEQALAVPDRRTVTLVSGEPGIGKTRLVAEVASKAHRAGTIVLLGRCTEELIAPFAPWVEALGRLFGEADADLLDPIVAGHGPVLARLLPGVRERFGPQPTPDPLEPALERSRLVETVDAVLTQLAGGAPVLVVLEDLHWADEMSLTVLNHLARPGAPGTITLVGTYRQTDVDRNHALAGTLAALRRVPDFTRLRLGGLTRAELSRLVETLAGQAPDHELVEALAHQTAGNPFFAVELLRHLAESGAYVVQDGRWVPTAPVDQVGLPEAVRDVLGRRLSALSDEAISVLQAASVVGAEFDVRVVEELFGGRIDPLVHLEAAERMGLVAEHPRTAGVFRFAHTLIRQTVLEELSLTRRARLHWQVGRALRARAPGRLDAIAFHLVEGVLAGDAAEAASAALDAAGAAVARAAYDDVRLHYGRAWSVIEQVGLEDPLVRWRALLLRAWLARMDLESTELVHTVSALLELAEAHWPHRVADVIIAAAPYWDFGLPADKMLGAIEGALASGPSPEDEVQLLIAQSSLRFGALDLVGAREAARQARDLAHRFGLHADELEAIGSYIFATNGGLSLAEERRDAEAAGRLRTIVGEGTFRKGRPVDLEAWQTAALYALRVGDRTILEHPPRDFSKSPFTGERFRWCYLMLELANADGRLDDAEAWLTKLDQEFGKFTIAWFVSSMRRTTLRIERADVSGVAELSQLIPLYRGFAPAIAVGRDEFAERFVVAGLPVETPSWETVAADVDAALGLVENHGPHTAVGTVLVYSAALAMRADCRDWAERLLPLVDARRGEYLTAWSGQICGAADLARAQALAVLGHFDEAIAAAEAAVELDQRFRSPAFELRSQLWLGQILLRRNGEGDADRAARLLDHVTTRAAQLGLELTRAEAGAARHRLRAGGSISPS